MVFGTRPEAIKLAPVVRALGSSKDFRLRVCVTGQHRQMLDQALADFSITPDVDLNLMRHGQDLSSLTASVLQATTEFFVENKPDLVLVHGDTTTAFASAQSAFYLNIPIGHVEAGLRTLDIRNPFPEEFNRQSIGRMAQLHFAPTETARTNLISEGVSPDQVVTTGNTVIDTLQMIFDQIRGDSHLEKRISSNLRRKLQFDPESQPFVLITGHRRENFGIGFKQISKAVEILASRFPEVKFVWPLHLNPNVEIPVRQALEGRKNVSIVEPLDYFSFVFALQHCYLVLTDSGGIQEEAPSFGKPVVVMRETTERPEAVQAGTALVAGARSAAIVSATSEILTNKNRYQEMSSAQNPFGDGQATSRILSALQLFF